MSLILLLKLPWLWPMEPLRRPCVLSHTSFCFKHKVLQGPLYVSCLVLGSVISSKFWLLLLEDGVETMLGPRCARCCWAGLASGPSQLAQQEKCVSLTHVRKHTSVIIYTEQTPSHTTSARAPSTWAVLAPLYGVLIISFHLMPKASVLQFLFTAELNLGTKCNYSLLWTRGQPHPLSWQTPSQRKHLVCNCVSSGWSRCLV